MTMYCPACGQERLSIETNYCSRCGFLLTGAAELISNGGVMPSAQDAKGWKARTPRNRGLKKGLFIFLLAFLIVPLISIITIAVKAEPYGVVIAAILLTVGGLLRMAYALLFQSNDTSERTEQVRIPPVAQSMPRRSNQPQLPEQREFDARSYVAPAAANWRDTSDLQPASIVDSTTQLLEQVDRHQ
ncbi:MAG: hypothetical protein ABJA02_07685 [Acidobacteriota bacterium]